MANNPAATLFSEVVRQVLAGQLLDNGGDHAAAVGEHLAFALSLGTGRQPVKTLACTDIYRPNSAAASAAAPAPAG
jgi:hypothetical protein